MSPDHPQALQSAYALPTCTQRSAQASRHLNFQRGLFSAREKPGGFQGQDSQTFAAPHLSPPRHVVDPAHFGQLGIQRLGQLPQFGPVPALPGVA